MFVFNFLHLLASPFPKIWESASLPFPEQLLPELQQHPLLQQPGTDVRKLFIEELKSFLITVFLYGHIFKGWLFLSINYKFLPSQGFSVTLSLFYLQRYVLCNRRCNAKVFKVHFSLCSVEDFYVISVRLVDHVVTFTISKGARGPSSEECCKFWNKRVNLIPKQSIFDFKQNQFTVYTIFPQKFCVGEGQQSLLSIRDHHWSIIAFTAKSCSCVHW